MGNGTSAEQKLLQDLPGKVLRSDEDNDLLPPEEAGLIDKIFKTIDSLFPSLPVVEAAPSRKRPSEQEFVRRHLPIRQANVTDQQLRTQISDIVGEMQIQVSRRPQNTFILSSINEIRAQFNNARLIYRPDRPPGAFPIYFFPGSFPVIATKWIPHASAVRSAVWRRVPYATSGLLLAVNFLSGHTDDQPNFEITHFEGIVDRSLEDPLLDVDVTATLLAMRATTEEQIGLMSLHDRRRAFIAELQNRFSRFYSLNQLQGFRNSQLIDILASRMPGYHPNADPNIDLDIRSELINHGIRTAEQVIDMSPTEQRVALIDELSRPNPYWIGGPSKEQMQKMRNSELIPYLSKEHLDL